MTTSQGPIEVYAARDMAEAQFVQGLLADAAIEARIVGEPLGAVLGEVPPLSVMPRLWVRAEDAGRARPLIGQYRRRRLERAEEGAEEPFCYHCGQAVDRGQSPCPACGQPLDWAAGEGP